MADLKIVHYDGIGSFSLIFGFIGNTINPNLSYVIYANLFLNYDFLLSISLIYLILLDNFLK